MLLWGAVCFVHRIPPIETGNKRGHADAAKDYEGTSANAMDEVASGQLR